jgi:hypothetical protein
VTKRQAWTAEQKRYAIELKRSSPDTNLDDIIVAIKATYDCDVNASTLLGCLPTHNNAQSGAKVTSTGKWRNVSAAKGPSRGGHRAGRRASNRRQRPKPKRQDGRAQAALTQHPEKQRSGAKSDKHWEVAPPERGTGTPKQPGPCHQAAHVQLGLSALPTGNAACVSAPWPTTPQSKALMASPHCTSSTASISPLSTLFTGMTCSNILLQVSYVGHSMVQ